jgi:hypothetical protein
MSDTDGDKKSRKRFLRFRMPRVRRSSLRATEELKNFRKAIESARRTCPNDGSLLRIEDVYDTADYVQTEDGRTVPSALHPQRSLVCPSCGYTISIDKIIQDAQADAAHLKRASDQLTVMAFAICIGFGTLGFLTSNVFSIIGGLLFGTTLFVRALALRYRHWQAINRRVFEARAPIFEWIRSEFRS